MRKRAGQWSLHEQKQQVQGCPWNCKQNHEHYVGSYQDAVRYFLGDRQDRGPGDLLQVVIRYQLGDCQVRSSAELYEILMLKAKEPYYWIPEAERSTAVLAVLKEAEEKNLIHDEELTAAFTAREDDRAAKRLWKLQKFQSDLQDGILG